jgi:hypothetical protein
MSKIEPEMQILKTATCKTLSGKSTMTYQVGCTPESDILFRCKVEHWAKRGLMLCVGSSLNQYS